MKKYLIALLVLAMATYAAASSVWLEVDDSDEKTSYLHSDTITINLVADFAVGSVAIGRIDGPPTAGPINPFHANFTMAPNQPGTLVNAGNVLISTISIGIPFGGTEAPAGDVLYSFEYHIPDLLASTYITIDDVQDSGTSPPTSSLIAKADYSIMISDVTPLEIHVTPEPMTIALLGLGGLLLRRRK